MHSIPQVNQLNPALGDLCKIYISLPLISSDRISLRNTGFGFHDVFYKGSAANPDNYYVDLNKLGDRLKPVNHALANVDIDLIGAGFPVKEWYITFDISSHLSVQISYPRDIVILKDENFNMTTGITKRVKITNLDADATAWNSFSISASKEIFDGLRVGARLKYLNGMADIRTSKSAFNMNSVQNPLTIYANPDYKIQSSLPVEINPKSGGYINDINFKPIWNDPLHDYLFTPNHGLAIDGGLTYEIDEETQLSASFTDLGFIRWKNHLNTFTLNKTVTFSQADILQFVSNTHQDDLAKALVDSLKNNIAASGSPKSYMTILPFSFYAGISRELSPELNAGAVTWIEINSGQIRPSLTLSLNYTPIKALAASVSYTIMNNRLTQIGTGLAVGNRIVQFYIVTDNIVTRFVKDPDLYSSLPADVRIIPYNARMLSLRFGINLIFGCNNKSEKGSATKHNFHKRSEIDECPAYRQ